MWNRVRERLSVDYIKHEILKTVYGDNRRFISSLDPRTLILWYLVFAIVPWFFFNKTILIGMTLIVAVVAFMTEVSGLILAFLLFGMLGQLFGFGLTAIFFGGDLSVFWSLSSLLLKLLVISLASIAMFASLDPERFANGLLALGVSSRVAFGISYAYRIVPVLIDEYHNIINAYRLRGRPLRPGRFYVIRAVVHWLRLIVKSFYPMMLNTAKRTRTTVEGLELRGFTYASTNGAARALRLADLRFRLVDAVFLLATAGALLLVFGLGIRYPL